MGIVAPMGFKLKFGITNRPIIVEGGAGKNIANEAPEWFGWDYIPTGPNGLLPYTSFKFTPTGTDGVLSFVFYNGLYDKDSQSWFTYAACRVDGKTTSNGPAYLPSSLGNYGVSTYWLSNLTPGKETTVQLPNLSTCGVTHGFYAFITYEYSLPRNENLLGYGGDVLKIRKSGVGHRSNNDGPWKYRQAAVMMPIENSPVTFWTKGNDVENSLPITYSNIQQTSTPAMPSHYISTSEGSIVPEFNVFGRTITSSTGTVAGLGIWLYAISK